MEKQKKINKENKEKRKALINFLKNYDIKCPDCGKLFFGEILYGTYEESMDPLDIGFYGYLSCGKCPECAKKCYDMRHEILERDRKLPCLDDTLDEFDGDIDLYFLDLRLEIECYSCLDENYTQENIDIFHMDPNNLSLEKRELIDLFEYLLG